MMAADATIGNADTPLQTPPVQPFPPPIQSPLSQDIIQTDNSYTDNVYHYYYAKIFNYCTQKYNYKVRVQSTCWLQSYI